MNTYAIEVKTIVTVDGDQKLESKRPDTAKWYYSGCEALPANDGDCDGKAKVEVRAGAKDGLKLLVITAASQEEAEGEGGETTTEWVPTYPTDECGRPQLKFKTRHKLEDGTTRDSAWIELTEDRFFDPYNSDQLYTNDVEELEWLIFKNSSETAIDRIEVCVARGAVDVY